VSREDKARFEQVVMPYLDDAFGLARWLTGNRVDAEDVVQEACLRALRGMAGFAGTNARAWTLAIVRNAAHDWLRKNRPQAVIHVGDLEAVERMQSGRCTGRRRVGRPHARGGADRARRGGAA
jgi:RNA polymerase sigma factor (sigma-70 family)